MHIYNSDGPGGREGGNGVRRVARHLAETRGLAGDLVIDTDSGPKRCAIHRDAAGVPSSVSVEMGPARVLGDEERCASPARRCAQSACRCGTRTRPFFDGLRACRAPSARGSSGPSRAA